ncbi:MAG: hypothetical protein ACOX6D_09655 [Thermoguttaceae bacterium]
MPTAFAENASKPPVTIMRCNHLGIPDDLTTWFWRRPIPADSDAVTASRTRLSAANIFL